MRANGDVESAELCKDIRSWWHSEDKPGIPLAERLELTEGLRNRLLNHIDFGVFPPLTMYIIGWPIQLCEDLLASIQAKAWLYCLCRGCA